MTAPSPSPRPAPDSGEAWEFEDGYIFANDEVLAYFDDHDAGRRAAAAPRLAAEVEALREAFGAPANATAADMIEARRQELALARNTAKRIREEREALRAERDKAQAWLKKANARVEDLRADVERKDAELEDALSLLRSDVTIEPGPNFDIVKENATLRARTAALAGALEDAASRLENIRDFIGEQTDRRIHGLRADWLRACTQANEDAVAGSEDARQALRDHGGKQ